MTSERKTILTRFYDSPCGRLLLGAADGRLCLCDWTDGRRHRANVMRTQRMVGAVCAAGVCEATDTAARQLDEYFALRRRVFSLPLLMAATGFQRRAWEELLLIPYGTTVSYSEQARRMGCDHSARAVAGADGANPMSVIVPCHRVVGSTGRLTGYTGGLERKEFLLRLERGEESLFPR